MHPINSPYPTSDTSDHQEIEWQFEGADLPAVERWILGCPPDSNLAISEGSTVELVDTYLDTDDWRFFRAGYALRVRQSSDLFEATLKALKRATDGVHRRREINEALESADPDALRSAPGQVGRWVGVLAGPRELRRLFEVRTRRRTFTVRGDGAPLGQIALDETTVPSEPEGEPGRLSRVEIEADSDSTSVLGAFVEEMRSGCGLQPAKTSKYELGLAVHRLKPVGLPDLGSTTIVGSMSIGEVAFAILRRNFASFLSHEPGARIGEDPEELHEMRVASRRLRAAMRLFADFLPARAERARRKLGWVADALGRVRDLDVQLEWVKTWAMESAPDDSDAIGALASLLEGSRAVARKRMFRALNSRRYDRFVASYIKMLRIGPSRRSTLSRLPALSVAPDLVGRCYSRVRKAAKRIDETSSPREYHELRIRCKRLHYALESIIDLYGERAGKAIGRLKALQDILGLHQDAVVAASQLRYLVAAKRRRLPPETAFAMGAVAERCKGRAAELRGRFPEAYRKIRKPWKRLKGLMEKLRLPLWSYSGAAKAGSPINLKKNDGGGEDEHDEKAPGETG